MGKSKLTLDEAVFEVSRCAERRTALCFAALQSSAKRIYASTTRAHCLCGFIPNRRLPARAGKAFRDALTRHEAASTNKRLTYHNSTLEWRLLHCTTHFIVGRIQRTDDVRERSPPVRS